jgi:serine/threonine-protein kinase
MGSCSAQVGDIVEGRYRLLSSVGVGGMGSVFLAEHTLIRRRVALKILHAELAVDADVVERFMNEARIAGTLGHPNIAESTDMGFTGESVPYIVFEYLEGATLVDEIYRLGGLPVRRAARIGAAIASALHAAHNAGVVHRDLKSENVILTDRDDGSDHVKVLDFGISLFVHRSRDLSQATTMGTPEYMSPEQLTDPKTVDRRTDIYALGVILYEMLAARRPFTTEGDTMALGQRIITEAPPPIGKADVPAPLASLIVDKLLAKDPAARPQSMAEVEAALDAFVTREDGTPIPKPPRRLSTSLAAVGERPSSSQMSKAARSRVPHAIAAAGIVVGIVGIALWLRGGSAPPAPRDVRVDIDADATDARVLVRHRSAPAPASLTLVSGDVPELVEVSAPGRKTARYWLVFDRPAHLRAHLEAGDGVVEATEAQTLVALGARPADAPAAEATTSPP